LVVVVDNCTAATAIMIHVVCCSAAVNTRPDGGCILWPPCVADADIIFHPVVSSFFFFFSSPNLSGRTLDVYHTSTHGVALVQISNAGLKRATRGSLKIQHAKIAKKSPSGHHPTTLLGYIFATKAYIDHPKKAFKQQYLLHMFPKYGELRPTRG